MNTKINPTEQLKQDLGEAVTRYANATSTGLRRVYVNFTLAITEGGKGEEISLTQVVVHAPGAAIVFTGEAKS